MVLTVHLHTRLRREGPASAGEALAPDLPPGSTIVDLMQALHLHQDPEHLVLVVNGRVADAQDVLADGDVIHLFPAISGG